MSRQFESEPVLDEATIAELWDLDAGSGFMQELVAEFNLQNQRLLKEIGEAAESCAYEPLRFSVHTLKGSSANVGAFRQAAIALAVENACKAEDCQEIQTLIPTLTDIAVLTEQALRNVLQEGE